MLAALYLCLTGLLPAADWVTWQDLPRASDNFSSATYHLINPADVEPRGVLVVIPAPGGQPEARVFAQQNGWNETAREMKFALLVADYGVEGNKDVSNSRRGSGESLRRALRELARLSGLRDLDQLNMAVYGVGMGAQLAANLAQDRPDEVLAFAAVLGAYWEPPTGGGRRTPGLFVGAADQSDDAAARTRSWVEKSRTYGAFWAWARVPTRREAVKASTGLAQSFLTKSAALRQNPDRPPTVKPESVGAFKGWVVMGLNQAPVPADQLPRSQAGAGFWYPDEKTAQVGAGMMPQ